MLQAETWHMRSLSRKRDLSRFVQFNLGAIKGNCPMCAVGSDEKTDCPILTARKLTLGERSGETLPRKHLPHGVYLVALKI